VSEAIIARIKRGKHRFEILVKPSEAYKVLERKPVDIKEVLVTEVVYKDSRKGIQASQSELKEAFETDDIYKIAETILKKGEIQITTEYRRELIERRRRQIIDYLCTYSVDPRTNKPHPRSRIEKALEQAKVRIDPFKPAEEQVKDILPALSQVIPLKVGRTLIKARFPASTAARARGALGRYGDVRFEEWLEDGSLQLEIEIPSGLSTKVIELVSKMNGEILHAK